jgi:TetR/AcrR family tetracycline transcriptional repressor
VDLDLWRLFVTDVETPRAHVVRPPRGLDRETVVRAALRAIDDRGPHSLTMRGLGQDLGVEAMSLYRYVSGREDLLEAVVALLLDNFRSELDETIAGTWQGYLQALAHAVRRIAVEHPAAFPLVATRHPAAPWLRPPLRSLELVEQFLSTLLSHGFTDDQAVGTYRAFSSFLLGQLLLESAARGAETGPAEDPLDEGGASVPTTDAAADTSANPTVMRLRSLLSEDRSTEEFEIGLETLLDRLELRLTQ